MILIGNNQDIYMVAANNQQAAQQCFRGSNTAFKKKIQGATEVAIG
jgi:hypothetical protein